MDLSFNYCLLWLIFSKLGALIFSLFSNIDDFFPFKKIPEYSLALPLLKSSDENCSEVLRNIEIIVLDHKSHLDIPRLSMVLTITTYENQHSSLFWGQLFWIIDVNCLLSYWWLQSKQRSARLWTVQLMSSPDFLLCIFWTEQAKLIQNKAFSEHQKAPKILSL